MPGVSLVRKLRDALHSKLVENSTKREFIPKNDFDLLMSREKVLKVFQEIVLSNIDRRDGKTFHPIDFRKAELVFEEYRKILAILVFIGHEHLIMDFLNHGRGDKNLPFYKDGLEVIAKELMETNFSKKQYCFIAVEFKKGDDKVWPDEFILPFIMDMPIRNGEGGYGKIYEVEIHEGYYDPSMWMFFPGERKVFARKELILDHDDCNDKIFAMESNALKILQTKYQHPNIIPLLACYKYGTQYSFIFPRAECDLYTYFEKTPPPQTKEKTIYLFEQISKLAAALNQIHDCEVVLEVDGQKIDFSQIGYHRDLKPKNILKMGEVFMIADFGLARFKKNTTNSRTKWEFGESTYSAPECKRDADVSRLADIWALGCIFSEVVTFVVLGMKGIEDYKLWRRYEFRTNVSVDIFYDYETDRVDNVLKWFEHLRVKSGRDQLILDVLELVEEMLAPVSTRPRAVAVMSRFSEILVRERRRNNIMDDTMAKIGDRPIVESPDLITDNPVTAFTPPTPEQSIATEIRDTPPTTQEYTAISRGTTLPTTKRTPTARRDTLPTPPQITATTRKDTPYALSPRKSTIVDRRSTLDSMMDPLAHQMGPSTSSNAQPLSIPEGSSMNRSVSEHQRPSTSSGIPTGTRGHTSNDLKPQVSPPTLKPLFYKVPEYIAKRQGGESRFGYLEKFDTVFLIDDSKSMSVHWDSVAIALCRFLELATLYDSDGVDLHFMNSEERIKNARTVKAVFSIFRRIRPDGDAYISLKLDKLLSNYISRFKANQETKRLNLIVITDGNLTRIESPSDVIINCAKTLDSILAPRFQVGVQFVLIGSSETALGIFKDMDDNLWKRNDTRDMVDTTPYNPDMDGRDDETLLKIMCGAVNRFLDKSDQ